MISKSNKFLISLLSLNFVLRFLVALRPLIYIDNLTIPDDAYLSLTLARNIAKGLGPFYGLDYTNGFQPLYVFLMAPIYAIFPNDLITPVHIALVVLAIFDTMTLYMLYKLVSLKSQSAITPFIIMIAWIFNPYVVKNTLNGLETAISMFFIVTCCYLYFSLKSRSEKNNDDKAIWGLGIIIGLAMLTRIDNTLLGLVIGTAVVIDNYKAGIRTSQIIRKLLILASGVILICLPWVIYSFHYTGDILPVSGRAVHNLSLINFGSNPDFANWYPAAFIQGLKAIVTRNPGYIILISILIVLWPFVVGKSYRELISLLKTYNVYLCFSLLLFVLYIFYVFGFWYFGRYLYPILLIFNLYLIDILDSYILAFRGVRIRQFFVMSVIGFFIIAAIVHPAFRRYYFQKDTATMGYMNIGLWARDNFANGTKIGSLQTGALGYFATNLRVVNLDGVVNRKCFQALRRNESIEYLQQTGIKYVLAWENDIDFIKMQSRNFSQDDLVLVKNINGFKSYNQAWYEYEVKL